MNLAEQAEVVDEEAGKKKKNWMLGDRRSARENAIGGLKPNLLGPVIKNKDDGQVVSKVNPADAGETPRPGHGGPGPGKVLELSNERPRGGAEAEPGGRLRPAQPHA